MQKLKYEELNVKLDASVLKLEETQSSYINDKKDLNNSQQDLLQINKQISELEIKLEDPNSTNNDLIAYNAAIDEKVNIENKIIIIELDLKISGLNI